MFRICPNRECPDRLLTGAPPELEVTVIQCPACDTPLGDAPASPPLRQGQSIRATVGGFLRTIFSAKGAEDQRPIWKPPSVDKLLSVTRRATYQRAAETLGMSFAPADENLSKRAFYALLQRGAYRSGRDILQGEIARSEVILFADHYLIDGEYWHAQTVAAFRLHERRLPLFSMRQKSSVPWVGEFSEMHDITLGSHPEFSGRYFLRGKDEQAVRSLFSLGVLAFFSQEEGWSVEGGGQWLVIYRDGVQIAGEDLPQFLNDTARIADIFPTDLGPQHDDISYLPDWFYACPACGDGVAVETFECLTCGSVLGAEALPANSCPECGEDVAPKTSECSTCGLALD